ncbi:MAG: magnesium/cobalt transporter CorA [Planctomycetota bacterium]
MVLTFGKRLKIHLRFRRRTLPGSVPGTVAVDPEANRPVVRVIRYGPDNLEEKEVADLDSVGKLVDRQSVTWVDVQGLGDAATITRLGEIFNLHPLALEDVVNTHQRAKVEEYGEHLFIVARMLTGGEQLNAEQVSVFIGANFVLTFQEKPEDCLDPVRKRLRKSGGRIRQLGADYLAYALLDAIVDAYFPVLEQYGEALDRLDDEISTRPSPGTVARIHQMRGDLLLLRRAIWPLRDDVGELLRAENPLVSQETRLFLRDCYDHTFQIIDLVDTCREMCADLREYYLSTVNNRMSEIMKLLTIMATIFIPLSFIAGVYGMNFDPDASPLNMPELRWTFGYPLALGLMAGVAGSQLLYFWRRGWLRRPDGPCPSSRPFPHPLHRKKWKE